MCSAKYGFYAGPYPAKQNYAGFRRPEAPLHKQILGYGPACESMFILVSSRLSALSYYALRKAAADILFQPFQVSAGSFHVPSFVPSLKYAAASVNAIVKSHKEINHILCPLLPFFDRGGQFPNVVSVAERVCFSLITIIRFPMVVN
jgi:hypothetical protein